MPAHRGAVLGGFPENALPWTHPGIVPGIDGVQVNPQLTTDGQ
ncbi:hypothetical protein [Maliponia aquimaris]|nr:hypothetical protein [Maliponia aquimaris]